MSRQRRLDRLLRQVPNGVQIVETQHLPPPGTIVIQIVAVPMGAGQYKVNLSTPIQTDEDRKRVIKLLSSSISIAVDLKPGALVLPNGEQAPATLPAPPEEIPPPALDTAPEEKSETDLTAPEKQG